MLAITPDFSSLNTTNRIIDTIRHRPDGLTIGELSDLLNRPISMLQICLKSAISERTIALKQQKRGEKPVKVYVLRSERLAADASRSVPTDNHSSLTPIGLREVAGLTKLQLAHELGLSVRTITDWEQKRTQPRLMPSQLKQMMSAYRCTLDDLIAAFE
jgi:DNA-binding transcriptional regulator YiaG